MEKLKLAFIGRFDCISMYLKTLWMCFFKPFFLINHTYWFHVYLAAIIANRQDRNIITPIVSKAISDSDIL